MSKKVTLTQLSTALNGLAQKSDARFVKKTDVGALAAKSEVTKDELGSALKNELEGKANSSNTLGGYGITDAYTKSEVDTKISDNIDKVYKPAGNKAVSELTSGLLVAANLGNVYNVTDTGKTTADFVSGAGKKIEIGADVAIVDIGTEESPVYKFNVLSGFVDLSGKVDVEAGKGLSANDFTDELKQKLEDIEEATDAEVQAIVNAIWSTD